MAGLAAISLNPGGGQKFRNLRKFSALGGNGHLLAIHSTDNSLKPRTGHPRNHVVLNRTRMSVALRGEVILRRLACPLLSSRFCIPAQAAAVAGGWKAEIAFHYRGLKATATGRRPRCGGGGNLGCRTGDVAKERRRDWMYRLGCMSHLARHNSLQQCHSRRYATEG
jgi:hypothetical protein